MSLYRIPTMCVTNQKGGVGKSMFAGVFSSYSVVERHTNTLLIDVDLQANTSDRWVGMDDDPRATGGQLPPRHPAYDGDADLVERSSIADIYYGKAVLPHSTYINKANGYPANLDVIVAHPDLLERVVSEYDNKSKKIGPLIIDRLREFIHSEAVAEEYQLVVLDTGPGRNPVFRSALRAATHACIPFEAEDQSIQGVNAMLQVCESENFARTDEDQLVNIGCFANKVRQVNLHEDVLDTLYENVNEAMFPRELYFPLSIKFPQTRGLSKRRNRKVKRLHQSIFELPQNDPVRIQTTAVCEYVYNRIFASSHSLREAAVS